MGFANNVRNNAIPEWRDFYIDYDKLRARVKKKDFEKLLYSELTKVNNFYFLLERRAVEEKDKIFDEAFTEMPHENFEDLRAQTENTDEESDSEARAESSVEPDRHMQRANLGRQGRYKAETSVSLPDSVSDEETRESEEEDTPSESSTAISGAIREHLGQGLKRFMRMPRGITRRRKEKAITEFLHTLVKITTYRDLNSSAMLKLAKKHSSSRRYGRFYDEFEKRYHQTYFFKSRKIEQIRTAIKQLYKRMFAKNQPEKARKVFRQIKKGLESSDWLFICSGFLIGVTYALAILLFPPIESHHKLFWAATNVYFGFIIFGFCIKVFKTLQINYKFIFNFDVCSSMNNSLYLMLASTLLFSNLAIYALVDRYLPWMYRFCVAAQICILFIPFDVLFYNSRLYLIGVFARIILQPLSTVRFRHFYFADVAQSFSFSIQQVLCAFKIDNGYILVLVSSIFPVIRIMQCLKRYTTSKLAFPHIANCLKFSLSILFTLSKFAVSKNDDFFGFFVLFGIASTVASLLWDIFVDWAILRSRRVFPRIIYHAIVGYDIVARFIWAFKVIQKTEQPVLESIVEIIRRFLWTLLRVEVEHLNNCDEFKMKNVISLTAGELFYKKDQVEIYRNGHKYADETETEGQTEGSDLIESV